MHIHHEVVSAAIDNGKFYVVNNKTGRQYQIYQLTEDKRFCFVDADGLRRVAAACIEGCDCGENEYYIPMDIVNRINDESVKCNYAVDIGVVSKVIGDVEKATVGYIPGDWVTYRSEQHQPSGAYFNYPEVSQLVYVVRVYSHPVTKEMIMHGLTSDGNGAVTVEGEAWRFKKYNIELLKQSTL